jgi:DNA-binding transcriptional LysR family regulator
VAVAESGNVTRAAEQLHISQPSLSAAIKQLESQLGVELLTRHGRRVTITPSGELLLRRSRELLAHADAITEEIRSHAAASPARLRVGISPTARYGVGPRLLAACAARAPAVMLYTSEDTTGALLRDVATSRLDLALTFCAPQPPPPDVTLLPLLAEPAVVHLPDTHPLATRTELTLSDLADETILVASSHDSAGFTDLVLAAFTAAGITPHTRPDPYPDLGLQAVREHLGVVIYARGAFPDPLPGSAFVPLTPPVLLPFHLATPKGAAGAALRAVADAAQALAEPDRAGSESP